MLELNFDPFPVIETQRLVLRQIEMDDAAAFFELRTNKIAMEFIDMPRPGSVEEIQKMISLILQGIERNTAIAWVIAFKHQPKVIGTMSYHRIMRPHYRGEIGYMIHPDLWRKGLATEAIKATVNYGFNTIGFHTVEANVNPGNVASKMLLEKLGFEKEAHFKENHFHNGKFFDSEIYSIINKNDQFSLV